MAFSIRLSTPRSGPAFTLIELLIVVAIISILAAIATPNFLEAQVRAKVSRARSDMRTVATGLEGYKVDNRAYPEGTDNPAKMAPELVARLGSLAPGFYALRTRGSGGEIAGIHFWTLTTPVAYIAEMPTDPFARGSRTVPFAYRNAKETKDGWILTSVGPDHDLLAEDGRGNDPPKMDNPLSTAVDGKSPARIADINERAVIHFIEGTGPYSYEARRRFEKYLSDLSYDPTNGTLSDGDLYRKRGYAK